jgi:uncharacterized OB-fold protein
MVALVRLEEGPLLMSSVVNAGEGGPKIGGACEVVFEEVDDEITLPKFRMTD